MFCSQNRLNFFNGAINVVIDNHVIVHRYFSDFLMKQAQPFHNRFLAVGIPSPEPRFQRFVIRRRDKNKNAALYTLMSCDPNTCKKVGKNNDPLKTCGNGIVEPGEMCDTGFLCKEAKYQKICEQYGLKFVEDNNCSNECTIVGSNCGDGIVDAGKEECDNGAANKDGKYGGCTTSCTWGPRCGDGIVQEGDNEECDEGANNGKPGSGCTVACRMIVN